MALVPHDSGQRNQQHTVVEMRLREIRSAQPDGTPLHLRRDSSTSKPYVGGPSTEPVFFFRQKHPHFSATGFAAVFSDHPHPDERELLARSLVGAFDVALPPSFSEEIQEYSADHISVHGRHSADYSARKAAGNSDLLVIEKKVSARHFSSFSAQSKIKFQTNSTIVYDMRQKNIREIKHSHEAGIEGGILHIGTCSIVLSEAPATLIRSLSKSTPPSRFGPLRKKLKRDLLSIQRLCHLAAAPLHSIPGSLKLKNSLHRAMRSCKSFRKRVFRSEKEPIKSIFFSQCHLFFSCEISFCLICFFVKNRFMKKVSFDIF